MFGHLYFGSGMFAGELGGVVTPPPPQLTTRYVKAVTTAESRKAVGDNTLRKVVDE